jgi:hypothetical protein
LDEENEEVLASSFKRKLESLLEVKDLYLQRDTESMRNIKDYLESSNSLMRKEIIDFLKRKSKVGSGELKKVIKFMNELTKWETDKTPRNANLKISDDAMYNYINYYKIFINLLGNIFPEMIINEQIQSIEPPIYWGFSELHNKDIKNSVAKYYEPLKKFYGIKILNNFLYEIQKKCKNIILLSQNTPTITNIKVEDKELRSVFDKRTSTLLFEYYILQIFNEYILLTKDPLMIQKILVFTKRNSGDNDIENYSSDFLIEQQVLFNSTEIEYIEGDVSKLQENIAKLLVSYVNIMINSKDTTNISYDMIMDRIFKLKETEKYTFTDRLKGLTEDERTVDTILKHNKLGVWSKGLMKGIKEYDPENYDQEKELTRKIAEIEKSIRKNNNISSDDSNVDIYIDDALEEMDSSNFIDGEEYNMSFMNDDYNDGDYYGDENEDNEDYN